jgi:hypothetical protein
MSETTDRVRRWAPCWGLALGSVGFWICAAAFVPSGAAASSVRAERQSSPRAVAAPQFAPVPAAPPAGSPPGTPDLPAVAPRVDPKPRPPPDHWDAQDVSLPQALASAGAETSPAPALTAGTFVPTVPVAATARAAPTLSTLLPTPESDW